VARKPDPPTGRHTASLRAAAVASITPPPCGRGGVILFYFRSSLPIRLIRLAQSSSLSPASFTG